MARFGRVATAMVTPFDEAGALDVVAAADLARWLVAHGNDGLVLAGSTGEGSVLDDDEKVALWQAVRAAVDVPLVAGSTSNDTAHSIHLTKLATAAGVDGILAVTPYYNRPSQAGIEAHFRAVADATELPVMIYDIPIRAGRKVATEVLLRLAHDVPNVLALKDAAGNPAETARLIAHAPADFEVYSGDDHVTLPFLAVGAVGMVGVATHWIGEQAGKLFDAFESGNLAEARRINAELLPSFDFETSDEAPNPLPAKALMRALGHRVGQCRLPMGVAPSGLDERASALVAQLGLEA